MGELQEQQTLRKCDWCKEEFLGCGSRKYCCSEHEIDSMYETIKELKIEDEIYNKTIEIKMKREKPFVEEWQKETGKLNTHPDYIGLIEHYRNGRNEAVGLLKILWATHIPLKDGHGLLVQKDIDSIKPILSKVKL